jgi:hypothetical protein
MKTRTCLLTATLVLAFASAGVCAPIHTGLVSFWPLDVDNGGTTPDLATGNNLNIIGSSTIVPGRFGTNAAFAFDGTSQYLTLTHTTNNMPTGLPIAAAAGGYTVAMWLNAPSGQVDRYAFAEGSTTSTGPLLLLQTAYSQHPGATTNFDMIVRNNNTVALADHRTSFASVYDSTWHHVAFVDNRGNVQLYVDGVADTNFTYTYTYGSVSVDTTSLGALLRSTTNGFFQGAVDDVAVWERPLSQAEVQSVMTNSIPLPIAATPPTITWQPTGLTNHVGDRATFIYAGVMGSRPLSLQWLKNGVPVPNATNATLIFDMTQSGTNLYSLAATNAQGSAVSSQAWVAIVADPTPNLANGLLNYWPLDAFNQTSPLTTPDIYYNHNDFQLFNMDSSNTDPNGVLGTSALAFNGTSQYGKRLGGGSVYGLGTYSLSFWVKSASASPQQNKVVFADGGNSSSLYFLMGTENVASGNLGRLNFKTGSTSPLADRRSTRIVFDGNWHHVVWADANGAAKLYIDGVQDETDFTYTHPTMALGNVTIGCLYRTSASLYFNGSIDAVAVWNRTLTWSEVQQLKNSGVPQPSVIKPTIAQPFLGSTNHLGDRLTLSPAVNGTAPLAYQWYQNGSVLAGATDTALSFYFTTPSSNSLSLIVSNLAGAATNPAVPVVALADGPVNLSSGLAYYWPLDTVDSVPSTPDQYSQDPMLLTLMDANSLVTGHSGNALSFDGFQGYTIRSNGFPVAQAPNYSVALWVNGADQQPNRQVFAEGGAGGHFFLLGTESASPYGGALNVKVNPGMNDRKTTRTVFDNTWHHIVWVDENGAGKVYVDGVLDETDFSYVPSPLNLQSTTLGALYRTFATNYFWGLVDEVAVWNRRLSLTEIGQLYSGSVPLGSGPIAPLTLAQPADQTNGVWQTDSVSFTGTAAGTGPLSFQWRRNGVDIPATQNPSATSTTLTLSSVQPADAGSYQLVIANNLGAVTSRVAQLTVIPYVPATSGEVLDLDFNLVQTTNVQPGFTAMTLAMNATNFGGVKVTVSAISGGTVDSRDRVVLGGNKVTDNPPLLTQAQLYNDFIYNTGTTDANGIRLLIERLAPNTSYAVTVWSYDRQSSGARISDWTETASGTSVVVTNGYTFDGSVVPTKDYDDTFSAILTSSATGKLQLEGRRNAGSLANNPGVFINALRLVANPVIQFSHAQVVNGNLRLTVQTQYPGQTLSFLQSTSLSAGSWAPAQGRIDVSAQGTTVVVDFPLGTGTVFYRATTP